MIASAQVASNVEATDELACVGDQVTFQLWPSVDQGKKYLNSAFEFYGCVLKKDGYDGAGNNFK